MRQERDIYDCVAVIGSVTRAIRARDILRAAGVGCEVVKAESGKGENGCVYGVACSCLWGGQIQGILQRAGVRISSFERRKIL